MGCIVSKSLLAALPSRGGSPVCCGRDEDTRVVRDKERAAKRAGICGGDGLKAEVVVGAQLRAEAALADFQGWPPWLVDVAGDAISGWTPRRANSFEKLEKIGQGTYSNVYKARDFLTGKIVALKKVRFDSAEPESLKFMAREILILRKLDHPNVLKLEGLVTSRMSCSLYLVFEYMDHDLSGLASRHDINFSIPQVKCYMKQFLSGLEHCHNNGILHRDIKGSNLLINNDGILKIADFGLATSFDPEQKKPMTSRVVTLWYRPPELLLGANYYGVGVDLWSAGCILAELLAGKPIMAGRTEVEQLHKIFKLCGSPPEAYWKKYKLPNSALFKPQQQYKRCISETFKTFTPSSIPLIETLLSMDPNDRATATDALNNSFFSSEPHACEPCTLPVYPPSKEMDMKLRDEARRKRHARVKGNAVDGTRRARVCERISRAVPAPEANAELPSNMDRWRVMRRAGSRSKSEKFPPPHQDATVGRRTKAPVSFVTSDTSFRSALSPEACNTMGVEHRRGEDGDEIGPDPPCKFICPFNSSAVTLSMNTIFKCKSNVFTNQR